MLDAMPGTNLWLNSSGQLMIQARSRLQGDSTLPSPLQYINPFTLTQILRETLSLARFRPRFVAIITFVLLFVLSHFLRSH